jgi:hypothetical protein
LTKSRILERDDRESLRRAFEDFEKLPFPKGSSSDAADELKAELAQYDGWATGLISSLVGGSEPSQELAFDADLQRRLIELSHSDVPRAASDAARYLDYLGRLRELVELALSLEDKSRTAGA